MEARSRTPAGAAASAGWMTSGLPTRVSSRAGSAASARNAPGRHSGAPLSPLITSTAIDAMRQCAARTPRARELLFGLDFGRLFDDALAPIEAVRGDARTQMRLARLRIDRQRRLRQRVV